ncbi:MAG: LysR substrate-binding domain-containing protein [Trebonia sp.]
MLSQQVDRFGHGGGRLVLNVGQLHRHPSSTPHDSRGFDPSDVTHPRRDLEREVSPDLLRPVGRETCRARNACREAGFEPDVRYVASDLLLQIHLAETGYAAAVIPGLLLAAVPRPAARIMPLPGRPHRRLTTGVHAGAGRHPAIRAFREALRQAVREAIRSEARN